VNPSHSEASIRSSRPGATAATIPGMSEERKSPAAALWLTVGLVAVLVGYPLSFGPDAWFCARFGQLDGKF